VSCSHFPRAGQNHDGQESSTGESVPCIRAVLRRSPLVTILFVRHCSGTTPDVLQALRGRRCPVVPRFYRSICPRWPSLVLGRCLARKSDDLDTSLTKRLTQSSSLAYDGWARVDHKMERWTDLRYAQALSDLSCLHIRVWAKSSS
jgi:hypothetical protein